MMHRRNSQILIAILTFSSLFLLWKLYYSDTWTDWREADQDEMDLRTVDLRANKSAVFSRWHQCITDNMLIYQDPQQFYSNFVRVSSKCDSEAVLGSMGIVMLQNSDEKKYALLPKINTGPHNLFTIGVGRDIRAEKQFRRKMLKLGNRVDFYGADPIPYGNADLYSQIGSYFQLAVGGKSGISNARVLGKYMYSETNMVHIDIGYYFREILNVTKIDNLWFDAEGAEYNGIFDIFYRDGKFDKNGIELCQANIEIHMIWEVDQKKALFLQFIRRLWDEKRYGFFFAEEYYHMRIYLFNFESPYCLEKF